MLTKMYDEWILHKRLVSGTELIYICISFGKNNEDLQIKYHKGEVQYISKNRISWQDERNFRRTLTLSSFGQLVPGYNYNNITFYGLFFPEEFSLDKLLKMAKILYLNIIKYTSALEKTIENFSKEIEENKKYETKRKNRRYIEQKRLYKRGDDWLTRLYHHVTKNTSLYDEWKLNRKKVSVEFERAVVLYNKGKKNRQISIYPYKVKRYDNWDSRKVYPKTFKKFFDEPIECKVLKKHKWKVPGEKR